METYHEQKKRENDFLTSPAIENSPFYRAGWHQLLQKKNGVSEKTVIFLI